MKTEIKCRAVVVGAFVFALIILFGGAARAQVEIRNWHDLNNIRRNLSGSYVLMNDLDETTEGYGDYNAGFGWDPIGGELYDDYFAGKFDGRGNTIAGLAINRPGTSGVGLFKHLREEAEISDVGLLRLNVIGGAHTGGLSGRNFGIVSRCYVKGEVKGENPVGGLIGRNDQGGLIISSYAEGDVEGTGIVAGGLVGANLGRVEDSYATADVHSNSQAGGLIGANSGSGEVISSYSTSAVSGGDDIGGLVGQNFYGRIENSYAAGSIAGGGKVGGLVGLNYGDISSSYSSSSVEGGSAVGGLVGRHLTGTIAKCFATGNVTGTSYDIGGLVGACDSNINNSYARGAVTGHTNVGGLIGRSWAGGIVNTFSTGKVSDATAAGGLVGNNWDNTAVIENSFWDEETSEIGISQGGEGKDTSEMKTRSTFTDEGWDFDIIWDINALNDGYPFLRWQRVPSPPGRRRPSAAPEPDPEPEYPLPPEGFKAMPGAGFLPNMKLWWHPSPSPNVAKYKLYASTGPGAYSAQAGMDGTESLKFWMIAELPADTLEYTHTGLSRNVRYYYAATSVNEEGLESNVSSNILSCVAGTDEINEHEAVSWGPERMTGAPEPEAGDGSSCLIATAAYGSAFTPEVAALRNFRDVFLLSSGAGNWIVQAYYAASPVFAEAVYESGILRKAARLHLAPFARLAGLITNMN